MLPVARSALLASVLVAATACRLTLPLAADREEHAHFAATPKPTVSLDVVPFRMGASLAPRCAAAGEASCLVPSQIIHAAYLVKHPRGSFLIESGLSAKSIEDLQRFSAKERYAFGWTEEATLASSLARAGWPSIDFVLVTHAHWDHTGGLVDLWKPRVVLGPGELEYVRAFPKDAEPTVMPHHLEGARIESFTWSGGPYENFPRSRDWFGDGSVVLVPLPGHTPGSYGVFLDDVRGRRLFFVGDAAWSMAAIELPSHKLAPLSHLTDADATTLSATLWRLHHLHATRPDVLIVPTHDAGALRAIDALVH